jgi:CRP-like cAMP-binding protein
MSPKRVSSVRSSSRIIRPRNRLLSSLPAAELARIRPHLQTVPLTRRQILLRRGEPISHVYFPNGGMCSVTAMMKNGDAVEVATVGDEGVVGISAYLGGAAMPGETMVQVPSADPAHMTAERIRLTTFRKELEKRGALHDRVSRYSQGAIALIMQSTACMALHPVPQRCCRWLLMTHDRIRSDQFHLSQEFLAMMLGATRPTVTLVARALQQRGLIRYTHARMTIVNRKGLEAASCECYATVKSEFDRLGL